MTQARLLKREKSIPERRASLQKSRLIERAARIIRAALRPLVEADVTWDEIELMTKHATVHCALRHASRKSGSINQSLLAAITGLGRPEISDLLNHEDHQGHGAATYLSPTQRMIRGWQTDAQFRSQRGYPRPLVFHDAIHGFTALARKYARDVPPKAILSRMLDLGVVDAKPRSQGSRQQTIVRLLKKTNNTRAVTQSAEKLRVLANLAESFDQNSRALSVDVAEINALSESELAAILLALRLRGGTFLEGLKASLSRPATRSLARARVTLVIDAETAWPRTSRRKARRQGHQIPKETAR